jgi:hypothetical protein
MKLRILRAFEYQETPTKVVKLPRGEHDLPDDLALKVLRWGKAIVIHAKAAPANKVVSPSENKERMGGKAKHSGRARPKSKPGNSGHR